MPRLLPLSAAAIAASAWLAGAAALAALPAGAKTVWDGVYSAAQAQRGHTQFDNHCAACHGAGLSGNANDGFPPLSGKVFLYNWNSLTVDMLFDRIHLTMPQDHPGSLDAATAADITAFILAANEFPAGASELPGDDQVLKGIEIDTTKPN